MQARQKAAGENQQERESRKPDGGRSEQLTYFVTLAFIVLGLYFSSFYSYLLFHSLIEITTIAVAFTLFILTLNTRRYQTDNYLNVLGIGYAFIALIDLHHTLAYKGMDLFPGYGANLPTQLWIGARYLQAVTLLAAPLVVARRVDTRTTIGIYAVATSVLMAMVYSGNFPDCFIEGKGLTAFKIGSEYVITALLLFSLYLFYIRRKAFNHRVFLLTAASITCTAFSEIAFTAYVSVYGFANLVGHFAKLAAFYLIYRAILVTGLQEPFDLIFRDLKRTEEALRKSHDTLEEKVRERIVELHESEERYRSLIRKVQTAIVLHDGQGQLLNSNPLARELLGLSEDQLIGKSLIDPEWHFLREDGTIMPVAEYPVSIVLSSQRALRGYVTGISRPDKDDISWVLVNAEPEYDDTGKVSLVIVSFVDITERKRAQEDIVWNLAINQALSSLYIPLVMPGTNNEQIANIVLEGCRQLTSSTHGFVAEIDSATGDLIAHTLTKMIHTECKVEEEQLRKIKFPRSTDGLYNGLWGHALNSREPFYTNAPVKHPASVGIPKGHIAIERYLAVPVLLGGELVGEIALSNSARDYTDRDVHAIQRISEFYALAIQTKRMEEELSIYREHLEEIVKERTVELEEARNLARQYLDIASVILVAIDTDRRVSLINQKGCEVLESTPGEIIGKDWFETFVPEKIRRDVVQGFRQLMEGELEPVEYFEHPVLTQGGRERLVAWHNVLLRDGESRITGTLSSGEDITERRRAEKQIINLNQDLQKRATALEAANKELDAFAYSVSHDLRAPLRHIDGFLELLQKKAGTALDEQGWHYMDAISEAARKMGLLIDDLLSFSRMGRHTMSLQQVDLGTVVRDIIRELEPDIAGRHIAWIIGDLPAVRCDAAMLRMVMANLISNALKFTRPRQQAQIEIGSQPGQDSETVIFVRDNGVGFDMAYADKLFGVFQRLHRADEFEGTGIGLASVGRIIARHGGRAWAQGECNKGATFCFSLPHT